MTRTVRVRPDGSPLAAREGESILETLYGAGLAYKTGCRRGGCGVCKVDLRSGAVEYRQKLAPQVMSEEELTDGTCLSCLAVPKGDVEIEMREGPVRVTCRPMFDLRRL